MTTIQTAERTFNLTLTDAVKTQKVKHLDPMNWEALKDFFSDSAINTVDRIFTRAGQKIDWALFVPAQMKKLEDGATTQGFNLSSGAPAYSRCRANLELFDCIVLDIDNDPKTDQAPQTITEARAKLSEFNYIFYTSFNHMNENKSNVQKFRIVLPLAQSVSLDQLQARKQALKKRFPSADPAGFVASQPFYVPMIHSARKDVFQFDTNDGVFFDVLELPEAQAPAPRDTTYIQTTDLSTDLPMVQLADGQNFRADELYHFLADGYAHKRACFRLGDSGDRKPGCFIYRHHGGLQYFDTNGTKRFIPVFKTLVQNEAEDAGDEAPSLPMWKRKPKIATVPEVIEKKTESKNTLVFDEQQDILEVNDRYLDPAMVRIFPETGITVIKSPKGTGKSTIMKALVKDIKSKYDFYGDREDHQAKHQVLLLGHRINLMRALTSKTELNIDFYLDIEEDNFWRPHLGISIDSLPRLHQQSKFHNTTVIIDESEQVFQHLTAETLKSNGKRTQALNVLLKMLRTCQRVILLDADFTSDLSLEVVTKLRTKERVLAQPILGIDNKYIFEGRSTEMYESWYQMLAEATQAAEIPGNNIFISTNYREKGGNVFAQIFEAMGKKVLLVSSDTSGNPEVQEFLADPSEESKKYEVIIATPTAQTGISVDNNHFTHVYGFYWQNVGTYQDIDQGLSRVRQVNHHRVWIQEVKHSSDTPDWRTLKSEALNAERGSRLVIFDEEDDLNQAQYIWAEIHARITSLTKAWSQYKAQKFVELRTALGYELIAAPMDKELHKIGKLMYDAANDMPKLHHSELLWETPEIDEEEFERLSKKRRDTDEHHQVERYRFKKALGDKWSMESLTIAVDQDLLRLTRRLEQLIHWTDSNRVGYDLKSREINSIAFTDATHLTLQAGLYDVLCDAIGIPLPELVELAKNAAKSGVDFEITVEQLKALSIAFEENKKEIAQYQKVRIKDPTNEKNLKKVWDATLGAFLPLKVEKKQKNGERKQHYFIDSSKRDLVLELFPMEAPTDVLLKARSSNK